MSNDKGSITYLNSGDWIENLSSLEYTDGQWKLYRFSEELAFGGTMQEHEEETELTNSQLFDNLLEEFSMMKS
jgi:hypothetical protein